MPEWHWPCAVMIKIAVIFHRFGPYHHARLNATGRLCNLVGIEMSAVDRTNAWDKIDSADSFPRVTLFEDRDIEMVSPREAYDRLSHVLSEARPDVVAIPGWSRKCAIDALLWCIKYEIPAIVMSDSNYLDEPRNPLKEWIKGRIVRLYSRGLVAGAPSADYLARLGMKLTRVYTGYDVVDNEHFEKASDSARRSETALRAELGMPENYFLASSRFIQEKNLFRLLKAYSLYLQSSGGNAWKLVLLGDGYLKAELVKLRHDLGLDNAILMPGFKQYHDLPSYYGLASAFVLASTRETWGLVVNEAMASGCPVLVSERCGCASDLLHNGVNGFTFDPYSVEQISQAMLKISSGETDVAAMGKASREIISMWTPDTFAANLIKAAQAAMNEPVPKMDIATRTLLWVMEQR